jgi:rhamnosyltransferase
VLFQRKNNLCAIVTSYNPDQGFGERLNQIFPQVDKIVIVDNNSDSASLALLRNIASNFKTHILYNSSNLGVATALNQGVNWAKDNNFEWVIFFDQDTLVVKNLVETLFNSYQTALTEGKIGLIGAGYSDFKYRNISVPNSSQAKNTFKEVKFIITSGSLMEISVFNKIGPFMDDLFIDSVDIEYCLRARAKGYKVIQLDEVLMSHSIGSSTRHKFIWKMTDTSNHTPLRRYYMMRNSIIVAKKYFFKYPLWIIESLFSRIVSTMKICFFEKQKIIKLKLSILGAFDGIFMRVSFTRRLNNR